jgi:hypothetical protein
LRIRPASGARKRIEIGIHTANKLVRHMNLKYLTICAALVLPIAVAACESKDAAAPSAPGAATPAQTVVADVTIVSPTVVSADGAQIKNVNQPVTLTIGSAVATGSTALTYTLDVAADAAFGNIVFTKSGLAAGASQVLPTLPAGATYYWRVRAVSGSLAGPNSKPRSFTIGPQVILSTPIAASPSSSAALGGGPVTLTVTNVQKTGPAGAVTYHFQVADSTGFTNIVFDSTVAEGAGGTTSVNVTANLGNGTYWWRVQASDTSNGVTTPYSAAASFVIQLFNMANATMEDNPPDVPSWPVTGTITSIIFSDALLVDFDARTGANGVPQWPEAGFGAGGIQYTLGLCFNINSHWYCSAAVQFWTGRPLDSSGSPYAIAQNWFYDARWGPMNGYQPSNGELVGVWAGEGNLRNSGNSYMERTNVVLVPWGQNYTLASASSAKAPVLLPSKQPAKK